jgi:hypothetical protein
MSKRTLSVAVALALLAAGGWALAQQDVPLPAKVLQAGPVVQPGDALPTVPVPQPAVNVVKAPAGPQAPRGAPGRYAVALSGERGLLVDTATGKTWDLVRGSGGRAAWVPARKFDSDNELRQWLQAERQRAAAAGQERANVAALQAEADREAARRKELLEEHDQALRALEAARQRLLELERKVAPAKDKN